jgi:nucleotide-binding universal stress UspA family protein
MKVLIAYDGTPGSDAALTDLTRAGLPEKGEAIVFCVSELPIVPLAPLTPSIEPPVAVLQAGMIQVEQTLETAKRTAQRGSLHFRRNFQHWKVSADAAADSPAAGILERARSWQPDLIVMGTHGHTALKRLVLGSVSKKVVTEAHTSTRVGRKTAARSKRRLRLVVGIDGSPDSLKAVSAVAARRWPAGTAVRLITAWDPRITILGGFMNLPPDPADQLIDIDGDPYAWVAHMSARVAQDLRRKDLDVSSAIRDGDPKKVLVREAADWKADSVFVGARGLTATERLVLGSVSTAVTTDAPCSVEVVR